MSTCLLAKLTAKLTETVPGMVKARDRKGRQISRGSLRVSWINAEVHSCSDRRERSRGEKRRRWRRGALLPDAAARRLPAEELREDGALLGEEVEGGFMEGGLMTGGHWAHAAACWGARPGPGNGHEEQEPT